jgi:hypothetical protein
MRIPMVTQSRIPGGGGGEGVGDMAATQSRKKVVTEARGGVGSVRRINEGGGKVRVLGCWGGTAPVTSPKYRECSRGGGSGRPVEGGGMARRRGRHLSHRWPAGGRPGQRGRRQRVLLEEEAEEGVQDRGR